MTGAAAKLDTATEKLPEGKRQRFNRVAGGRMKRALKSLGLLRNLAKRKTYEFTEHEPAAMLAELRAAVDEIEAAFAKAERKQTNLNFGGL